MTQVDGAFALAARLAALYTAGPSKARIVF
jgi:hypothetical protein